MLSLLATADAIWKAAASFGAPVGTGLLFGCGSTLPLSGTVPYTVGFFIFGTFLSSTLYSLCELMYLTPHATYTTLGTAYVDPAVGFLMGLTYLLQVGWETAGELLGVVIYIGYWDQGMTRGRMGMYFGVFIAVAVVANVMRWNGSPYLQRSLDAGKLVMVIGMFIFSIVVTTHNRPGSGWTAPHGKYYRTEAFNDHFSGVVHPPALSRFLGWWAVWAKCLYAYSGLEGFPGLPRSGGFTAEARKLRTNLIGPAQTMWYRICLVYVVVIVTYCLNISMFSPMLLGPSQPPKDTPTAPVYVAIAHMAGVKGIAHLVNAVVLTNGLVATILNLGSTARAWTYVLDSARNRLSEKASVDGMEPDPAGAAPVPLPKVITATVPGVGGWLGTNELSISGILVGIGFAALAFIALDHGINQAFLWFTGLSGTSSVFLWAAINLCYVRARKALILRGVKEESIKMPLQHHFQPLFAYFCIPFFSIIFIFNGFWVWIPSFSGVQFVICYLSLPCAVIPYVVYKIWWRTRVVDLRYVNFGVVARQILQPRKFPDTVFVDPGIITTGDAPVTDEKKKRVPS
ncbi:hypothetical protein Q8F55_008877 [Vanrija albida]|uniref:Amino acid permease/ SLC12A domain-containing protein n=1 Tax=Vanrija albida TaxID=181172 RepID=A0ABR3PS28_9TREE